MIPSRSDIKVNQVAFGIPQKYKLQMNRKTKQDTFRLNFYKFDTARFGHDFVYLDIAVIGFV